MGSKLSSIPAGTLLFIDANVFLYAIFDHANFGEGSYRILKDVEDNSLRGISSTLVLDEVLYKMMLMEASNMNQISLREAPSFLKRFPEKITKLEKSWSHIQKIQKIENIVIKGITPEIFEKSVHIARTNKLLPHDASHLAVMESAGVKDIASNDSDFGKVKGIKVWQPSRMRL